MCQVIILPRKLQTWFAFFSVSIPVVFVGAFLIKFSLVSDRMTDILYVAAFVTVCSSTIFTVTYGFTAGQIACLLPIALQLLSSAHKKFSRV